MTRDFLRGLPRALVAPFLGYNILAHVGAILLTLILVLSGADWAYFEATRGTIQHFGLPAAIIGFFVPIVVPVSLYIYGEVRKSGTWMLRAAALAQAELIAYLISIVYKTFTGRMQPEFYTTLNTIDNSRDFHFGFLQHGVFWGWPSSHASVALALVGALFVLFPRNRYVQTAAVLYGAFIAFGVSVSIHWLSDALAGAILGATIGVAVARASMHVTGKMES